MPTECPLCGSHEVSVVLELTDVPTQDGVLWESAEAARTSPVGTLRLALCGRCSYLWNSTFEPEKVRYERYDVSLQHSAAFDAFVRELAGRLVEHHALQGRTVLEIGCGRGHFLEIVCGLGDNAGVGFDPSYVPPEDPSPVHARIEFVPDVYGDRHVSRPADLVVCRHVLDIVPEPTALLGLVRRTLELRAGSSCYLEVADARHTLGQAIAWNLIYERMSWFVPESLRLLFARSGLETTDVTTCWHDEYLGIEGRVGSDARAAGPVSATASGLGELVSHFVDALDETRDRWSTWAGEAASRGTRVAIWGAGARAIGFLNLVSEAREAVGYLVDVNPMRQGLYLPRTAAPVSAPQRLVDEPVDVILISNPTYAAEIRGQIAGLGVDAEVMAL